MDRTECIFFKQNTKWQARWSFNISMFLFNKYTVYIAGNKLYMQLIIAHGGGNKTSLFRMLINFT